MRALPIFCIILLLGIAIGFQGIAHAQTTSTPLQLLKQWNLFSYPGGVAVDSSGNVYVADTQNNAVKEIFTNGTIGTLGSGFYCPAGVAVDSSGNVYVADMDNSAVKEIFTNGTIGTLGSGFSFPYSVAVDSSGNVYVIDEGKNPVKKIFTNGTIGILGTFNFPGGVAVDSSGNVYVADTRNNSVKEILTNGTIGTLGSRFNQPRGVAVDSNGNVYVADTYNSAVKEIPAGNGTVVTIGSVLNGPDNIVVDSRGNIYMAEAVNNTVKEILANGSIRTVGSGFNNPSSVAVDSSGNVYVTDAGNSAVKEIFANGTIRTLGIISNFIGSIAVDSSGNVYVTDYNTNDNIVYIEIFTNGTNVTVGGQFGEIWNFVSDYHGNVYLGISESGLDQTPYLWNIITGKSIMLAHNPYGVAVDSFGNIYLADGINVYEMLTNGTTVTFGSGFSSAGHVAVDSVGDLFVVDNNGISEFAPVSTSPCLITNFTSNVTVGMAPLAVQFNDTSVGYPQTWNWNFGDNTINSTSQNVTHTFQSPGDYTVVLTVTNGSVSNTMSMQVMVEQPEQLVKQWNINLFNYPSSIVVDSFGNVYVADTDNNAVKKIFINGTIVVLGSGFSFPGGVAVDSSGNVYVADTQNNAVKEIFTNGTIRALGSGFYQPHSIAVDSSGNVYVSDVYEVREIFANGTIRKLGSGVSQTFGLAVDSSGNVYVADTQNDAVKEIYTNGTIVTLGSVFYEPYGVAVDSSGDVFVADWMNNAVKEILTNGRIINLGSGFNYPADVALDYAGDLFVADRNAISEFAAVGQTSTYTGNNIPGAVVATNKYTVSINFTNTGNTAWTSGNGDKLVMWGQTWNYAMDNDTSVSGYPAWSIPAGVTVNPGQSFSWKVSLTPSWSGSYTLEFQVVEGNTWLGNYAMNTMNVYAPAPNAAYTGNSISDMVASNTYHTTITYTNSGNTIWTSGKGDKLVLWGQTWNYAMDNDSSVSGYPAWSIPSGVTVNPGQSFSWNVSLTPSWSGSFGLGFQVMQTSTNSWLGSSASKTMNVYAPAPNAAYVSNSIPDMVASNTYYSTITYTNNGNTTWTSGKGDKLVMWGQTWNYALDNDSSVSGCPAWSIPSGVTVNPGQSYSWNVSLTPSWSGSFGLGFQVMQASTNSWLGSSASKTMNVYAPAPNSAYVSDSIPVSMAHGTTYNVLVNFTNTGNTTWTSGKGDVLLFWGQTSGLGLNNTITAYGYPAYSIPSGITVMPGQTYSWSLAMTPTTAGTYSIGFQVVQQSTNSWLGNSGGKTTTIN